jgi:hypothetical protein
MTDKWNDGFRTTRSGEVRSTFLVVENKYISAFTKLRNGFRNVILTEEHLTILYFSDVFLG